MKLVECMEVDTQDQADEREDWRSGLLGLLCAPRCPLPEPPSEVGE